VIEAFYALFYPVLMKQERPIIDSPLLEVAEILALGILRLREKQSAFSGPEREISLDFSGPSEPSWTDLKNTGKTHE
jgi:hypothetical protein